MVEAVEGLGEHGALSDLLTRALAAELPVLTRDGGFIAAGHHEELDALRTLRDQSRKLIAELQTRYAGESGIPTLKIRHNNVLGYYIEVTPTHADKLTRPPLDSTFIHRQTLASAVRFSSAELTELQGAIGEAADKALALELELFAELVAAVSGQGDVIAETARALATLDVAAAHADIAVDRRYVRPVVNVGHALDIRGGRHPVVEAALSRAGDGAAFIANDCALMPDNRLWLLTGPTWPANPPSCGRWR